MRTFSRAGSGARTAQGYAAARQGLVQRQVTAGRRRAGSPARGTYAPSRDITCQMAFTRLVFEARRPPRATIAAGSPRAAPALRQSEMPPLLLRRLEGRATSLVQHGGLRQPVEGGGARHAGARREPLMSIVARLRTWAREATRDVHAIYLAARDPRVPWYAKAAALCVAAYALSPIDLIPDFVPVLGYLDDVILVPLGILLVARLIPPAILAEHRATAARQARPVSRAGAAIIIGLWIGVAALILWMFWPSDRP